MGVFKTAVFWPLLLVVGLILVHITSIGLASPKAGIHTTSEIASLGRLLEAPFSLPDAMASGAVAPISSSSVSAVSSTNALGLADGTAVLGGGGPFHRPKAGKK
jgi:hypothetical protein